MNIFDIFSFLRDQFQNYIIFLQMSVKVGVRVRPFNQREQQLNCKLCVEMVSNTTRLLDLDDPKKNRDFAFDYSFWSHDGFKTDERGYYQKTSDKYSDQMYVYECVGKEILDNAWQGYHCCLFAYGQTGSGKSYSMIGYGANKGIVPISCQQIFKRIHGNTDKNKQFQVNVSMLEIYNQKVQDLLIHVAKRPKQGLKIRQHKTLGIYVQGLSKHYVDTYQSIEAKMQEGNKNRSVAATEMNASSSRAHTIISIQFKQKEMLNDKKVEKLSVIFLVDLAGSQRIQKTGAKGDRLKEAAGINKSLTVLGIVISSLADKAMGKGKGVVVPYRDSCLTRILQNALGGNSKTLMICAISPATDNYDETLSTLRYADQAKKIQNKAIINQSETDRVIRELTEQNQKLKKFMEKCSKMGINITDDSLLQKFDEAKSEMLYNNSIMKNISMSNAQKLYRTQNQANEHQKVDLTKAHLINLNQDPLLSKKIIYPLNKQQILIGRKNANPTNDIILGGAGVNSKHAFILKTENEYYITSHQLQQSNQKEDNLNNSIQSNIFINGHMITQKTRLFHQDRLVLGTNSIFLVLIPGQNRRIGPEITVQIDWQFAQQQMYHNKKPEKQQQQIKQQKIRQQQNKILKQKQEQLQKLRKIQLQQQQIVKSMEQKRKNEKAQIQAKRLQQKQKLETQLQRMKNEIQSQKKKINESEQAHKNKIKEKNYFQHKLTKYIPKVIEVNLIAKQFKRNISMAVKLFLIPDQFQSKNKQSGENDKKKKAIKIQVDNRQSGYTYFWDIDKFGYRYYIIKDLWEKYLQTSQIPSSQRDQDPFWDPPEHIHIGNSFLTMMSLAYMMDYDSQLALVAENGQCGMIQVKLIPTDQTGQINLSEQYDENQQQVEPQNLIGKPFNFTVQIIKGQIPEGYENVYVEYALKLNNVRQVFKTETIKGRTTKPAFSYKQNHRIQKVSQQQINYLQQNNLCFKVFGQQYTKQIIKNQNTQKPKSQPNLPQVNNYTSIKSDNKKSETSSSQNLNLKSNNTALNPTITPFDYNKKKQPTPLSNPELKKKDQKKDCIIF